MTSLDISLHMKMPIGASADKNSSESSIHWCIFSIVLLAVTGSLTFFFAATRFGGVDGPKPHVQLSPELSSERLTGPYAGIFNSRNSEELLALPLRKQEGFFIDIGTSSGQVRDSTRARHLERKGFTGVCAVPFPGIFTNRTCKVVGLPVSGTTGEKVRVNDCTGSPPNLESLNPFANQTDCVQVQADTMGIADLLSLAAAPPVIDYMALDTHGTEQAILENFPVNDFCARSWTVKHNYLESMKRIRHILEITMGCRVREGAGEYWARCPCDKRTEINAAAVTREAQVHEEQGKGDGRESVVRREGMR